MRSGSRVALAAPLLAFVAAIVALATAGSHTGSHASTSHASARATARLSAPARSRATAAAAFRTSPHVVAISLGVLPAAVQDSAVAPAGAGRLALLGGIDAAGSTPSDTATTCGEARNLAAAVARDRAGADDRALVLADA